MSFSPLLSRAGRHGPSLPFRRHTHSSPNFRFRGIDLEGEEEKEKEKRLQDTATHCDTLEHPEAQEGLSEVQVERLNRSRLHLLMEQTQRKREQTRGDEADSVARGVPSRDSHERGGGGGGGRGEGGGEGESAFGGSVMNTSLSTLHAHTLMNTRTSPSKPDITKAIIGGGGGGGGGQGAGEGGGEGAGAGGASVEDGNLKIGGDGSIEHATHAFQLAVTHDRIAETGGCVVRHSDQHARVPAHTSTPTTTPTPTPTPTPTSKSTLVGTSGFELAEPAPSKMSGANTSGSITPANARLGALGVAANEGASAPGRNAMTTSLSTLHARTHVQTHTSPPKSDTTKALGEAAGQSVSQHVKDDVHNQLTEDHVKDINNELKEHHVKDKASPEQGLLSRSTTQSSSAPESSPPSAPKATSLPCAFALGCLLPLLFRIPPLSPFAPCSLYLRLSHHHS